MFLLPLLDRPVRDHATQSPAAGLTPACRDHTPLTPAADSPATDRHWQPVKVTLCRTPLPTASPPNATREGMPAPNRRPDALARL